MIIVDNESKPAYNCLSELSLRAARGAQAANDLAARLQ